MSNRNIVVINICGLGENILSFSSRKLLLFGPEYPNIGIKPGRPNSHQSETNLIKTPEAILPGAPLGSRSGGREAMDAPEIIIPDK